MSLGNLRGGDIAHKMIWKESTNVDALSRVQARELSIRTWNVGSTVLESSDKLLRIYLRRLLSFFLILILSLIVALAFSNEILRLHFQLRINILPLLVFFNCVSW